VQAAWAHLQREPGRPDPRRKRPGVHLSQTGFLVDLASTTGNRSFAAFATLQVAGGRSPRVLARSPHSNSLEKQYERVIKSAHLAPGGYVSLLAAVLRDLLPMTADPDPDMGPAIVRIVDRVCKLAYQDWRAADPEAKPAVAERVNALTADAPYLQIGNAALASEILDIVTTLRTSFHSVGSSGYMSAQSWGTGILTDYARTRL
jgi:hypothetical protein